MGASHATLAGCVAGNNSFLFYKFDTDPYLYVAKASPNEFWDLQIISKYFIKDLIRTMLTSSDCNALYTGGDSFRIFNITDPYSIIMTYSSIIPGIETITLASFNVLYINTYAGLYVYYITDIFIL